MCTPCGTTLIVCPSAILGQWVSELQRHSAPGALSLLVYRGQDQRGGGGGTSDGYGAVICGPRASGGAEVVSAHDLAAVDIVVTTYDVLRADVSRQPELEAHDRELRGAKRCVLKKGGGHGGRRGEYILFMLLPVCPPLGYGG